MPNPSLPRWLTAPPRCDMLVITLLWLLTVVSALSRSFLPIDETRYVSVAWEMWHTHSFWVPHMNGETYADKPPLLFWLMHAGWAIFGVNEWWPKLIGPLASLLALVQLYRIAKQLGYAQASASLAPLALMAMLMWDLYSGALMFDILLTACLLGTLGPLVSGHFTLRKALVSGIWLGLALLAKGPAVFVTLLPIVASIPWWRSAPLGGAGWRRLALSLLIGTALLVSWALSAAWLGGRDYAQDLLWGQSVNRLQNSMAHARPFWWYFPLLPLLTFPWLLWRPAWPVRPRQPRQRLFWIWMITPVAIFCFISGKQIHYLMPMLPALALLIMDRLASSPTAPNADVRTRLPSLAIAVLGIVGCGLSLFGKGAVGPDNLSTTGAVALVLLAVGMWRQHWPDGASAARGLAVGSGIAIFMATQWMMGPFWSRYDVRAPGELLGTLESRQVPVAYNGGGYQATFQFAGRLTRPLMTLDNAAEALCRYRLAYPDGWLVTRHRDIDQLAVDESAVHHFDYRSGQLDILPVNAIRPEAFDPDCVAPADRAEKKHPMD